MHFAGDPALHTAGEVQRYLGGEPIVDELGRPVLNADGSYCTARAGQAVIHNRRDLAFAPDYLSASRRDPADRDARADLGRLGTLRPRTSALATRTFDAATQRAVSRLERSTSTAPRRATGRTTRRTASSR